MKKLFFLIMAILSNVAASFANYGDTETVMQFGDNMRLWCSTNSYSYRSQIMKKCESACRVNDKIMMDFARNSGINTKHFVVSNYLNGFEDAFDRGAVGVDVSNIRVISADQQVYSYKDSRRSEKLSKDYTMVACDIKVNGALNYNVKDLFYVRKGQIVKITSYEEVIDTKTGKRKVRIDFSDLESDNSTMGVSYNYSKHFPVGASYNYSPESSYFMFSVDFGINFDKDKYIIDEVDMVDIMNYDRKKKILDPKFFITLTPQVYFKYFAVGCGAGLLYMDGTEENTSYHSISISSVGIGASNSSESTTQMIKPMIRPVIKGFIPVSDELYISVSAGYDLIFGYKEKNGVNFGLGIQWEL